MCRAAARAVRKLLRTAVRTGRSKSASVDAASGVPNCSPTEMVLTETSMPPALAAMPSA
jgi:hypothetical protein